MTRQVDRIIYTSIKVTIADSLYGGQNFRGQHTRPFLRLTCSQEMLVMLVMSLLGIYQTIFSKLKSAT